MDLLALDSLINILCYLSPADGASCASCCGSLARAFNSESLWQVQCFRRGIISLKPSCHSWKLSFMAHATFASRLRLMGDEARQMMTQVNSSNLWGDSRTALGSLQETLRCMQHFVALPNRVRYFAHDRLNGRIHDPEVVRRFLSLVSHVSVSSGAVAHPHLGSLEHTLVHVGPLVIGSLMSGLEGGVHGALAANFAFVRGLGLASASKLAHEWDTNFARSVAAYLGYERVIERGELPFCWNAFETDWQCSSAVLAAIKDALGFQGVSLGEILQLLLGVVSAHPYKCEWYLDDTGRLKAL